MTCSPSKMDPLSKSAVADQEHGLVYDVKSDLIMLK